ncbi:uncharacterized protein LOC133525239 [Cydia pomonella]|uniref:uncharacterized protein LOC133525239 n=1 Tax=Cydia pomonella TaxID=82600 RepID=UPI002ADE214A|nr:uncharacterized protein LOC133525239 [Cydia pomonella]
MDEFFIECVRQYPCLWDAKLPSYKRLDVKDAAWKDIMMKKNTESVTQAKTKWKGLRDTHREKLKKINKTKSGQASKNVKPWKYMSHMEFLLPYMTNTERETNVSPPRDLSTNLEDAMSSAEYTQSEVSINSDSMPAPKKKKDDIMNDDDEEALLKLLKDMDDNREKRTAQREELRKELLTTGDPLKSFFDTMYLSTKQMPEFYQRSIKKKLFQMVTEAEDDIANLSFSGYCSNNYDYNSRQSRPYTNQAYHSSGHGSTYSPEPSRSSLQQTDSREDTTPAPKNTAQDSMGVTASAGTSNN